MPKHFGKFLLGIIFFFIFAAPSYAATYTVTKTADTNDNVCDSDCSFREAVYEANNNVGADTIEFNVPISDDGYINPDGSRDYGSEPAGTYPVTENGYFTFTISNPPFSLTDDAGVFINGYSQSGASRNTAAFGETINTVLMIDIYYDDLYYGRFDFFQSDNNHLTGLNIRRRTSNSSSSWEFYSANNNWIEGNFFGTKINGNAPDSGLTIWVQDESANNIFGTNGDGSGDAGERNLFGGKSTYYGYIAIIENSANDNNIIAGNYFGTLRSGRSCHGESMWRNSVHLGSVGNRVGTNYDGVSDSEESNIMGCVNGEYRGIIRLLAGTSGNIIQGNYIGMSPYGDQLGTLVGQYPGAVDISYGTDNIIKGNQIAHADIGIRVRDGTDISDDNTFRQNIFTNIGQTAISISGVSNDSADADAGRNDLQNHPVITSATFNGGGRYHITGTIDGNLNEAPWTIEVCLANLTSSGNIGCAESLGTIITYTGSWELNVTVSGDNQDTFRGFTSLATNGNGSTSEFGQNFILNFPASEEKPASLPEFFSLRGGDVVKEKVIQLIPENSVPWDSYLSVTKYPKLGTFRLPGSIYWQASDIHEVWLKSFFNHARILPEVITEPYVFALKYDEGELESTLPEKNLKMAYSEDGGITWKILYNSVLDTVNNTVSIVTKQGGHFMLVSGWPR